jgi:hypothetical protein
MTAEFDQLVDLTGVSPEDRARMQKVHELLVAAGPPTDLPAGLDRTPPEVVESGGSSGGATVIAFPRRRRAAAAILVAAAVAALCFGGGYVLANQARSSNTIDVVRTVPLQGEANSFASLKVGAADSDGNWPVQLTVKGLPPLSGASAHYILMVSQGGKPTWVCGMFKVGSSGTTTVTFSVPYRINGSTKWAVTKMTPGTQFPGHVVMTTS